LRVAIVAPSLRYVGGQAVQADLLSRLWQDDRDLQVKLIAVDPPFPRVFRWVEGIPFVRTILREPVYCWHLWRDLKDIDLAHIFSASYWSFLLAPTPAWLFGRFRGTRTIINYRSGEARDHLLRFRSGHFVLSRVDRIVVPSGYLVDVFREFKLKAALIPNIIDLSQFRYRQRKPLRPHLICTRGFFEYYCVDVVVKAFAIVRARYPDAQLDLVGGGPLESEIRSLVNSLNLDGVNFIGVSSRQQIGQHYDRADIFINASRLDNMPVSVIEAFGAGTPVVTTSPESMPYLIQHERTGLLSGVNNEKALAANVIRLLQNPDLASSLAENAHQQSRDYDWENVRGQWLDLYRGVMSGDAK
jgi:L-malate glycosyltransferase